MNLNSSYIPKELFTPNTDTLGYDLIPIRIVITEFIAYQTSSIFAKV